MQPPGGTTSDCDQEAGRGRHRRGPRPLADAAGGPPVRRRDHGRRLGGRRRRLERAAARRDLGIPAPGDIRACLGALLPEPASPLGGALEHRFDAGELEGHAFGNLLIAALAASTGGFAEAVAEAGRLLGAVGLVLPATVGPVDLKASGDFGEVDGPGADHGDAGGAPRSRSCRPTPSRRQAPCERSQAADQIVIGPGSLYTSVLAACCVPAAPGGASPHAGTARLRRQPPRAAPRDRRLRRRHATWRALARHGVVADVVLADPAALADRRAAGGAAWVVAARLVGGEGLRGARPGARLGAAAWRPCSAA